MQKQYIHNYFLIHKDKFEKNYQIVMETADENAIHDMRVSIKRLRLLYKFTDYIASEKFHVKKRTKLLDILFLSTAKLRDIQIQVSLIENAENDLHIDLSEWKKQYAEKGQTEKELMNRKISAIDYRKIEEQFLKSEQRINDLFEQNELSGELDAYVVNRLNKIKTLLNNDKPNFHKIRKRIKEITYLLEIKYLNEEMPERLRLMKQMGSLLGDWHDIEVFLLEPDMDNREAVRNYLIEKQKAYISEFNNLYSLFIEA